MEPVNLSEPKEYLIDTVKIFLFWILSKLEGSFRKNRNIDINLIKFI